MPVIEFGLMGVKPNHKVMDQTTEEGQVLQKAWTAVTVATGGPYWAYGGLEVGDQLLLWGFFAFDSVEHHQEFAKTGGAKAVEDLPKILSHPVFQKHMSVDADISPVLKAPLVQVTMLYFPAHSSRVVREKAASIVEELISRIFQSCQGVAAVRIGWSIEDDVPIFDSAMEVNQPGVALILLVGWTSVEARVDFVSQFDLVTELRKSDSLDSMIGEVTRLIECRAFGVSR